MAAVLQQISNFLCENKGPSVPAMLGTGQDRYGMCLLVSMLLASSPLHPLSAEDSHRALLPSMVLRRQPLFLRPSLCVEAQAAYLLYPV